MAFPTELNEFPTARMFTSKVFNPVLIFPGNKTSYLVLQKPTSNYSRSIDRSNQQLLFFRDLDLIPF